MEGGPFVVEIREGEVVAAAILLILPLSIIHIRAFGCLFMIHQYLLFVHQISEKIFFDQITLITQKNMYWILYNLCINFTKKIKFLKKALVAKFCVTNTQICTLDSTTHTNLFSNYTNMYIRFYYELIYIPIYTNNTNLCSNSNRNT